MHKSTQQDQQNQKRGPLVVAYIGKDDPLRGDSKGAVGVARQVAKMLGGGYDYVDAQSLSQKFNQISGYDAQLKAYARQMQYADIIIGHEAKSLSAKFSAQPVITEDRWNESYSAARSNNGQGLVAHDLTDAALAEAGLVFQNKVENIHGSLIGVLLGGVISSGVDTAARSMSVMAERMGHDVTFYLCPSRRTGGMYDHYISYLKKMAKYSRIDMQVMGMPYEEIANGGYNPYLGLLDQADHLALLGESGSLISEALYTKKPLYMSAPPFMADSLVAQGHIVDLCGTSEQVFRKVLMPRIDVTIGVAKSIAEEYLDIRAALMSDGMELPKCL